MKKIGLLLMAIVLAIGALGVGYAAWTDQIFINGTVNTGSVDIDAEYFSGSEIYKDVDNETSYVRFWVKDDQGALYWESNPVPVGNFVKVAYAEAAPAGDDEVDIVFDGAFPSNYLVADVIIHNSGTVPVIVDADIDTEDPMLAWLWDNGYAYVAAAWVEMDGRPIFGDEINGPVQMEPCDYAKIWLYLDLPQADELEGTDLTQEDFMDKDWSFTAHIYAIQWNEYEPGWWLP